MLTYLAQRILLAVPVFIGITVVVFGALRLAPGDPATTLAGENATREAIEAIRGEYGLDLPVHEQYIAFLGHLIRLDLGRSVTTGVPVTEELWSRYPTTLAIAAAATAFATFFGLTFGVIAAYFQRRWVDYGVMVLAMAGLAVPNYVLGLVLVLVFAVNLGLLPAIGSSTPTHYILPVVTVGATGMAVLARQTRAAMLEVLNDDYVRTARAKGLSERQVVLRHALRNALIPVVTIVGFVFGHLLAGTVIVESVFGIQGLGKLMIDRISARDFPTVQGAVVLIAGGYVFVNIVIDLAYVVLDRRVRLR